MKYCPRCRTSHIVKNGKNYGKQRYLCKECNYNFTRQQTEKGLNNRQKLIKSCVKLHLENMSNRGIGRILGINHQTVVNYLNESAEKVDFRDKTTNYNPIVEVDEMWSFLKDKKSS